MTEDMGTDEDIVAAIDEVLSSPDAPEDCMQLSELDGFLTGLAIGPEPVNIDEWLSWVIGEGFSDPKQTEHIKALLLAQYTRITSDIADGYSVDPLFWEDEEGGIDAGEWADGFMGAVDLRPEAWLPILEDKEARLHMVPILALACDEDGAPLLRLAGQDFARIVDDVETIIPQAMDGIRDYWVRQ